MRDPERIKRLCGQLEILWTANPDMRLGQLIETAAHVDGHATDSVYYVEDDDLQRGMQLLWENTLAREG